MEILIFKNFNQIFRKFAKTPRSIRRMNPSKELSNRNLSRTFEQKPRHKKKRCHQLPQTFGISTSTVNRTSRKLENCEDEACLLRKAVVKTTSRDRPQSAPYPRLKNSKRTSKCQFTVLENRLTKTKDRVARRGPLARAPGALKRKKI